MNSTPKKQRRNSQVMDLKRLIATPMIATLEADAMITQSYVNFLREVAFEGDGKGGLGKLRTFTFQYYQSDSSGKTLKSVEIPVISLIPVPLLQIREATFDFDIKILITGAVRPAFGFEGNDDNVTRDYYVQLYKSQPYIPDFKQVFVSEDDRRDYKKLREYLNNKEEILRILRMAGDEYYYGLSYSKLFATDYMQSLEDELKSHDPSDKILLRLNSVRPNFDYSGEYPVGYVETEILPVIRARYEEAARRDSLNQIAYMQIQKNVEAIQQDIFQAEQAIYASLSPEFRNQDFL